MEGSNGEARDTIIKVSSSLRSSRIQDRLAAIEAECNALQRHLGALHAHAVKFEETMRSGLTNAKSTESANYAARSLIERADAPSEQAEEQCASSEVTLTIWDKWVDEEYPNAFKHLLLAKDGGFSEVKDLYTHSRWIAASMLIAFVLYNVFAVIQLDCDLIFLSEQDAAHDIGVKSVEKLNKQFYVSRTLTDWVMIGVLKVPAEQVPSSIKILGGLELTWLCFYLLNVLYCFFHIYTDTGFKRWYHVQHIFWNILPMLSVYSAMKLLNAIVPTVMITAFYDRLYAIQQSRSKAVPILSMVWWVITVIISFQIGFDTALMKLRVVGHAAAADIAGLTVPQVITKIIFPVFQFLVQILGVVQLGPFVRARLYLFIFGGEDSTLQEEEIEIMETWNALLAKRIWRENTFLQFIAVMASFGDEDFQSLVLNENAEVKEAEIGK